MKLALTVEGNNFVDLAAQLRTNAKVLDPKPEQTFVLIRVNGVISGLVGPFINDELAVEWAGQFPVATNVHYDILPVVEPYT